MKTFKHKINGQIMTYKDGCMMIDRCVVEVESEPNLEYWEEISADKKLETEGSKVNRREY